MKKISNVKALLCLAIPMFFNPAITVKAQTAENNVSKMYLQTGGGATTHNGGSFEMGIQTVIKNKWSASFSYHNLRMDPANLPSDYQPESGIVFFIPYTNKIRVNMNSFSLSAGKYYQMGRNSWFTMEGGLSVVSGQKASFEHATQTSSDPALILLLTTFTSSNYTTNIENKTTLGAILKADANWALTSFMGLGAGVFANINSIQSPIGFNIKLTLGNMGKSAKGKK
jgi:hypothetical protein